MRKFEELLDDMAKNIIRTTENPGKLSPTEFEQKIYGYLAYRLGQSAVEYTPGSTSFPDVVVSIGVQKVGIEVKISRAKAWKTIGNSIMEGTAKPVSLTYVFMGKIDGDKLEIRYRLYESCIDNIVVTHSPRYHLDINLKEDESIFAKMNTTYDSFRTLDERGKIAEVKAYYRSKNDTDYWWIDGDESDTVAPLQITFVSDLDRVHIESLRVQLLARFPHMILKQSTKLFTKNKKYKDAAIWLVKQGYLHTNIRDMFSSDSDQKSIQLREYPTVYTVLLQSIPHIKGVIDEMQTSEVEQICLVYRQQYSTIVYDTQWMLWQNYVTWLLTTIDQVDESVARDIVRYK